MSDFMGSKNINFYFGLAWGFPFFIKGLIKNDKIKFIRTYAKRTENSFVKTQTAADAVASEDTDNFRVSPIYK